MVEVWGERSPSHVAKKQRARIPICPSWHGSNNRLFSSIPGLCSFSDSNTVPPTSAIKYGSRKFQIFPGERVKLPGLITHTLHWELVLYVKIFSTTSVGWFLCHLVHSMDVIYNIYTICSFIVSVLTQVHNSSLWRISFPKLALFSFESASQKIPFPSSWDRS